MISQTVDLFAEIKVGQNFPNALQFLSWRGYPCSGLPKTFQANNLVALEMPHSRIEQLWEDGERKVKWLIGFYFITFTAIHLLVSSYILQY